MTIGEKIKAARLNAGLTQEKAADELGVTRQTISNWENGRSYPDIVSVVKMSDLYSVSLDRLLKEDTDMKSDYLEHLEETTNIVRSNNRKTKIILISVYLIIWTIVIALFWIPVLSRYSEAADALGNDGWRGVGEFGYSLLASYIVLPAVTFVISYIIGKDASWGISKWFMPVFFGIMYSLADYSTFRLLSMFAGKFSVAEPFDYYLLLFAIVLSVIGVAVGLLASHFSSRTSSGA